MTHFDSRRLGTWGRNHWSRRHFLGLGLAAALLAIVPACVPSSPPSPLRVGTNVWPGFEGFYLARNLGYFEGTPVQMVEFGSSSEVLRAYRNGDLEVAALTLDETLLLTETNPQTQIFLIADISDGGDVILGKPGIASLSGLQGQRVGVEATALGAYVLTRALQTVNLTPEAVQVVPLEVSEHERAFQAGEIDAVVTFDPVRSRLLAEGATPLFDSRQIPGEIVDVIVTDQSTLDSRRVDLADLVTGWFRAIDYLKANPQDAATRVAPRQNITPEQFLESLEGLLIPGIEENQRLLSQQDPALLTGAQQLVEVMLDNQLLNQAVDPKPLLNDTLVQELAK